MIYYNIYETKDYSGIECNILLYDDYIDVNMAFREMEKLYLYWYTKAKFEFEIRVEEK